MRKNKMGKMKKLTAWLLMLAMLFSMLPGLSLSAYGATNMHQRVYTVQVRNATDKPVQGAKVDVLFDGSLLVSGETDATGVIEVQDFSNGNAQKDHGFNYTVNVSKEGYLNAAKNILVTNNDTGNLEITLFKPGVIKGTLSAPEGVNVANVTVTYTADNNVSETTVTDAAGAFEFDQIPVSTNPKLSVDGPDESYENINAALSFDASGAAEAELAFAKKQFDISFAETAGGTFTDENDKPFDDSKVTVEYGADLTFKFTANEGYAVRILDADAALNGVDGKYTLTKITEAHEISADATDTKAPVIINAGVSDADVWKKEKQITFEVEDNAGESGISAYISDQEFKTWEELEAASIAPAQSPCQVTENGTYYIYAVDEAKNFAECKMVEAAKIDHLKPVISKLEGDTNGKKWGKSYTVEFEAHDYGGEIASVVYSTGRNSTELQITSDGKYSFTTRQNALYTITVTDAAGNEAKGTINVSNIDSQPPVISVTSAKQEEIPYSNTSIEIEIKVTDGSGVSTVSYREPLSDVDKVIYVDSNGVGSFAAAKNGKYTINAEDVAGNKAVPYEYEVTKIDKDAPVITELKKDPDTEWTNGEVVISGRVTDAGSGAAKVYYGKQRTSADQIVPVKKDGSFSVTVSEEQFVGQFYIQAEDQAGNRSEDYSSIPVNIEKQKPQVTKVTYSEEIYKGFLVDAINVLTFGLFFKDKITIVVNANDTNNGNITSSNASGIAYFEYQLVPLNEKTGKVGKPDEKQWVKYEPAQSGFGNYIAEEIPIDPKNEGFVGTVYVRAVDVAGNVSEYCTDSDNEVIAFEDKDYLDGVTVTATTGSGDRVKAYPPDADNIWTDMPVTITVSGAECISGIRTYQYSLDGEDWIDMPDSSGTMLQKLDGSSYVNDQLVISESTNAVYYFRAVSNGDAVTEPGKETAFEVKIQMEPPAEPEISVAGKEGENGWYVWGASDSDRYPKITISAPVAEEGKAEITTYYRLFGTALTNEETVVLNGLNQPMITKDGTYELETWARNEANLESEHVKKIIKVDTTGPSDLEINLSDGEGKVSNIVTENGYAFTEFSNKPVRVSLSAEDMTSKNIRKEYKIIPNAPAGDIPESGWRIYIDEITLPLNSQAFVVFRATDEAGNSTTVHSKGIIVDDREPEAEWGSPIGSAASSGIYHSDVVVPVTIIDPKVRDSEIDVYSGLEMVTYEIKAEDLTDSKTGECVKEEGTLFNNLKDRSGCEFEPGDERHCASCKREIKIDSKKFNSNNVVVTITATDRAGNKLVSEYKPISIDVTAPKIEIRYDRNSPDSGKYYNADRIATITITERNFDSDDVKMKITNTDGVQPGFSGWRTETGSGNGDNTKHIATVAYRADGDYTFGIEFKDRADNVCAKETYAAGTSNPTAFTIDKTKPVVSVSFNNNAVTNGRFFNENRVATVTIVEHNFDISRVKLEGQGPGAAWSHNGNTHTATISYSADGEYTFDVSVRDMAGNASNGTNFGGSAAPTSFTIDTTITKPKITGVENGKAYKDDVVPSISFSDTNFADYTITLTRTTLGSGTTDVTKDFITEFKTNANGGSGTEHTFGKLKENDGIYTLHVAFADLAGNTEEENITFTLNRFGSVYKYDGYVDVLSGDGGAFVNKIEDDLVITEYNADKLVSGSVNVEVTHDGKPLSDVKYKVSPEINDQVAPGESGWYQYAYTLSKDNFAADGVYKVAISSKDKTGNSPENDNDEDKAIMFRVDSTAPEITSIVNLEEPVINAPEVTVKYTIFDAIGMKSIKVYVDDKLVGEEIADFGDDANNYEGSFVIRESPDPQTVRIVATDLAGNVTDTDAKDFTCEYVFNKVVTVSTNAFVRLYANKTLFWPVAAGILVLIGGVLFLIARKRKKNEE